MALHPAVAAVRLAVRRALADLEPGDAVVVACSGGADSLALLAATVFEARKAGWHVVGVDRRPRAPGRAPPSAPTRVVAQMAALGADETVSARVTVEAAGLGPEAAARRGAVRRARRGRRAFGAAAVLLGHTRDDQAETVLLGLARGSGGRSLAGMRRAFDALPPAAARRLPRRHRRRLPGRGHRVLGRPAQRRPGVHAAVRVRHRVLPLLEDELGPGVAEALARTADQLRADMDLLDELADDAVAEAWPTRRRSDGWPQLPPPCAAGAAAGGARRRRPGRRSCSTSTCSAMDALLTDWHGQKWVDLPGHVRAVRRDGRLLVGREAP